VTQGVTLAIDPVDVVRLARACDATAVELRRLAVRAQVAADVGGVVLEAPAWVRRTATWLEELAVELARRAAVVDGPAPSASGWRGVSGVARDLADGAGGVRAIVGGRDDLDEVRRSVAEVRRRPWVADLPGAHPGPAGPLTVGEELHRFGRTSHVAGGPLGVVRPAARALGAVGALADVHTLVDPAHDGWYGVADRVVAGAGLAAGGAQLLAATGLIALTPVGATAVAVVAIGAGVYALGSLAVDHRHAIADTVDRATDAVGGAFEGAVDTLGGWFAAEEGS
jgi:hypothetical protein